MHHNFNQDYVHHQSSRFSDVLREVVFGMEDGMVSTLGSITGIAIGSGNHYTVVLAGIVIIAVESISMGIGSYLSSRSQEELEKRKIQEETEEISSFPQEEKDELFKIYIEEGWPKNLAKEMTNTASQNQKLMLKEMAIRELNVFPSKNSTSIKGGLYMFGAYVIGGIIPLFSYFVSPIKTAVPISIGLTLIGLFVLGATTTKFTKQPFLKSGLRMLIIGGIALGVGLIAGILAG